MKKYVFLFLIPILFSFAACGVICNVIKGSGVVITESRDVSNFQRIALSGSGELVISQGHEESLTIEAEDNIMPRIRTEVKDGTLFLSLERESWQEIIRPTRPIKFNLTMIDITEVNISGSGSIKASDIKTKDLEVGISGSGDAVIDQLVAEELVVKISGSGDITVSGEVAKQDIHISGSGSVNSLSNR